MIKKQNNNLNKIVTILSDGNYHDGNTIGDRLQMTRSAVWKAIKKLESYGVPIDSVKRKGYALKNPLILLDRNKIKTQVTQKIDLSLFESIASTNDYLRTLVKPKGIKVCIAEQQTNGKGRLGRNWYSPFGKNIYLSCLFPFQKDLSELAGLSLVVSLAITAALKSFGVSETLCVKWPNDVLYDGKKIAGNLIEIQAETHGVSTVIIGIGVNVNMLEDEKQIREPWISLQKILHDYIDRNLVCARLINELLAHLHEFSVNGFSVFAKHWAQTDCLTNRQITLHNLQKKIEGKSLGVNHQGNLLLQLSNGDIATFSSGDTSVLKK